MTIATLINFCSNEYRFLWDSIKEVKKFSHTIIVSVSDHFFDGKKEDPLLLNAIFQEFPDVKFLLFPFFPGPFFGRRKETEHFWHNAGRMLGFAHLPKEIEYVLFLDADEIPDGDQFQAFLQKYPIHKYDFLKLYCYWYFREPRFQAKTWETSPLLAKRSALNRKLIMQKEERSGMFTQGKGEKLEGILGLEEKPMVHHYSWVRTKNEMLKKVRSWGHAKDRDWEALVEKEFSGEFQGKDFVHGYEFITVDPFISPIYTTPQAPLSPSLSHVRKITPKELSSTLFGPYKGFFKFLIKKLSTRDDC